MARALWSGTISFSLLNIPVQLMPGERRTDLHFHMMDARNRARVRYERVNAETGDEVPWKDIVKAFEYKKGSYVVLDQDDLKAAAPESSESVDIVSFIDVDQVEPAYFDRPYYLVPQKKAEKGYVLLRETLRGLNKAGLARVVIRTREHIALLLPRGDALMLLLLRYPQELIPVDDYSFPDKPVGKYRLEKRELEMARQLVASMSTEWDPSQYHDEFRAKLSKVIQQRMRKKGARVAKVAPEDVHVSSDKVVDFMAVLKRSLDSQQRTPAKARRSKAKAATARRRRKRA